MNLVLIPTYNEKENIGRLIVKIFALLPKTAIMVLDDNSPDGTAQTVKELQSRYPNLFLSLKKNKEGLGKAYIDGIKKSLAVSGVRKIIMLDADFSHNPDYLPAMLTLSEKCDVVIGSRYIASGGVSGWNRWREGLSRLGNLYSRLISRMPIKDQTAGFYVINVDALKRLDLSKIASSGYAFQIELKYLFWRAGARMKEFPIIFIERSKGRSKINSRIITEGFLAPWKKIFSK